MNTIEIELIISTNEKNLVRTADVNPLVALDRMKSDIVKALKLRGSVDDYEIFFSPNSKKDSLENYRPVDGDKIIVLDADNTSAPSIKIRDE